MIEANNYILNKISFIKTEAVRDNKKYIENTRKTAPSYSNVKREQNSYSVLQTLAKAIKKSNIVKITIIETKNYIFNKISSVGKDTTLNSKQ